MIGRKRLDNVQELVEQLLDQSIPGDLIETGVWRGGATIFMRAILKSCDVHDGVVWVVDSFEGLPEPNAERFPLEAKAHRGPMMTKAYRHFAAGLEDVQRNFRAYGMLD